MSDVVHLVTLAKAAREQLALALNALQNNTDVPDELMEVADPIAEAMSVFHRIERSQGAAPSIGCNKSRRSTPPSTPSWKPSQPR